MNFDKTKTTTLTLILMLTFSATILSVPFVLAHDPPWEIPCVVYAVARPNPVGVNQEVLVIFWRELRLWVLRAKLNSYRKNRLRMSIIKKPFQAV